MFGTVFYSLKLDTSITKILTRDMNTLPFSRGDTTCVTCSKVCKFLSSLNRHMVVQKDFLQVMH